MPYLQYALFHSENAVTAAATAALETQPARESIACCIANIAQANEIAERSANISAKSACIRNAPAARAARTTTIHATGTVFRFTCHVVL